MSGRKGLSNRKHGLEFRNVLSSGGLDMKELGTELRGTSSSEAQGDLQMLLTIHCTESLTGWEEYKGNSRTLL